MALDVKKFENVLRKQTGKAVRPFRADGFMNVINRYGTSKDDTEQYFFSPEPIVDDSVMEVFYEGNGLFAKIIDTPAEEAVKHGFSLKGVEDEDIIHFYESALEELDWEEIAMTGLKWARLFGGSLAIMLINDGRALEEPVDWRHIRSIDDIVIFDRSVISPDRTSLYKYDPENPFQTRGSRLGTPEWYEIMGPQGTFVVHDSRCLAFRNGVLPFNATNENYQLWGIPEYVRISRAIRNAEIAHESAPKMLSKSVQPVYKMKDLAGVLATDDGESQVLRRLQLIDMARGLLNSVTIDAENEDYSFQTFGFNGVSDVIDSSCNWLSALTCIPQTILFGRSPAGMNATGKSDFENYYNYVERIQKRMLRANLRYLLSVIFTAGKHTGEIRKIPELSIEFNPLWSLDETEEVQLESVRLQNEMTRANIANTYVGMEVIGPDEVRKELGKEDEINPENMLDDMSEEELMATAPKGQQGGPEGAAGMGGMMPGGGEEVPQPTDGQPKTVADLKEKTDNYAAWGNAPETAPEATKLPQDMENAEAEEEPDHEDAEGETTDPDDLDWITLPNGVHVPVDENGKAAGGPVEGADFSGAESSSEKHPRYKGLNDKVVGFVEEYKDNPLMFGVDWGKKEEIKKEIVRELEASGVQVERDEYDNLMAVVPSMSFEENRELDRVLNQTQFGHSDFRKSYLEACRKAGVKPRFSREPEEVDKSFLYSASGKLQSDGTPVYDSFGIECSLTDDEILRYSSHDRELNPEGYEKAQKAAREAVEAMTDEERAAVKAYTKQFGYGSYQNVNEHLATGKGSEQTAEFAERLTSALDHEIGAECVVSRGDDTIRGVGDDEAVAKLVTQISRGNFSHAKKLAGMLTGKTVSVPTAMSTSPGAAMEGYNRRAVQFVFKTPASAKGVRIDALSAFAGGRSEVEKKLAATGLFGSVSTETEVLFKPGVRYKIEAVDFVVGRNGKKKTGQVYITASILGENEDAEDPEDTGWEVLGNPEGTKWVKADFPTAEKLTERVGESRWLVKDTEAIMSFVPGTEVGSPDWLDDEIKRRIRSVGVIVVDKNGKILSGVRKAGDGERYGLLGGPGGHVEPGESLEEAAIRETFEEFGIIPEDLMFISLGTYEEDSGMIPAVFLCTEWDGEIYPEDGEMENIRFRTIDDILTHDLFEPFRDSLNLLRITLEKEDESF